jgi:hypothetical protein
MSEDSGELNCRSGSGFDRSNSEDLAECVDDFQSRGEYDRSGSGNRSNDRSNDFER